MIRGLYTSSLGMTSQMKRMDVITNNIANTDTTGYKKDSVITQSFSEVLMKRMGDGTSGGASVGKIGMGLFVDTVYSDFSTGALVSTNSPLDLAIQGKGYFVVNVPQGNEMVEMYTRDGSFTRQLDGTMTTGSGEYVQGLNGNIVLPDGQIVVNELGTIFVNGQEIDTLRLLDFTDESTLRKQRDNLYISTEESESATNNCLIIQNALEQSNVNSVQEMVAMINISRIYEANQRMITTMDNTLSRAVNDIARK